MADELEAMTSAQLRVKRRQRKGCITKHLGSLKRAIAESDTEAVTKRLEKTKLSFEQFELVQDALNEKLVDEAELTASEEWYAGVDEAYIQGVTKAHAWLKSHGVKQALPVSSNPTDQSSVSDQDSLVNLLSIPKVSIDKFQGDPLEYQAFIATFDELVDSKTKDDRIKLTRLLQYTAGPAKQAIKYCALVGGADGYSQARTILADRFGDKHILSQTIIADLKSGKHVSKSHELQQLADELKTGFTVLQKQGMVTEINTQQNILDILSRYPNYVKNKWRKHALDHKRKNSVYPDFAAFVEFASLMASDSCDPVYGSSSKSQTLRGKVDSYHSLTGAQPAGQVVKPATQASLTSPGLAAHGVTQSVAAGSSVNSPGAKIKPCVLCRQSHGLQQCENFNGLSPKARFDVVRSHKLCFNCFRDNHQARACFKKSQCSVPNCKLKHSELLHVGDNERMNNDQTAHGTRGKQSADSSHVNCGGTNTHLPLVAVTVNSDERPVYALLDSGSTNSFISEGLSKRLHLRGPNDEYQMSTLSNSGAMNVSVVSMSLDSVSAAGPVTLNNVLVIPEIPARVPHVNVDVHKYPHLADVPLLELGTGVQAVILIGMDNAHLLMPLEVRSNVNAPNEPYAIRTYFGWTLCGVADGMGNQRDVCANFVSIDRQVENLWKMDDCGDEYAMSREDRKVIELWDRETVLENGHYTIPIPWRHERPHFPDNKFVAERRLDSTLRKLERTGLRDKYDENMQIMINDGYAEAVPEAELNLSDGSVWFIPHHPVVSETRPGKVRIVHDCAATLAGVSLNNQCFQGPDLVNKLMHVLLRFRQYEVAVMADIQAMYMQVKVPPRDRNALRFLWTVNGSVQQFRMTSHLFGGVFCASSSAYALRRTMADYPTETSDIVKQAIFKNFYVDDLLQSAKSVDEALEVIRGATDVLRHGGFKLTKVVASDVDLISQVDEADRAAEVKVIMPEMMSKALGVKWEVCADTFQYVYKPQLLTGPVTRRAMLSYVSSMFDPLGFISAVTLMGKMFYQEATRLRISWDTPVPDALSLRWNEWLESLTEIDSLRFKRCMIPHDFVDGVAEIHNFCDGSQTGYGCSSYIRVINKFGQIHVALVTAKSRLAPLRQVIIPRLELASAVLAVKIDGLIRRELDVQLGESVFWSDSEITLAYIKNETRRFKVFVANRVSYIREFTSPSQWHHIEGRINPADIVSRGCLVRDLPDTWVNGPDFLWTYKSEWRAVNCSVTDEMIDDNDPEISREKVKSSCAIGLATRLEAEHPLQTLCDHFSSLYKLKKAVAWLLRVKDRLTGTGMRNGPIRAQEMHTAERLLIRFVQQASYGNEISSLRQNGQVSRTSPLRKLSPAMTDDLLVVGGRLKHSPASLRSRNPIILPYEHRLSMLIVRDSHYDAHLGTEWVLCKVRERFWIVGARKLIKKVKRDCVTCKRLYAYPMTQQMADLPPERCVPGQPAFAYVGLDLFGPLYVKLGRAEVKRYGCLFTCFNSRAVHIEKLDSLETDSFINGFIRFVARRGEVLKVWSDNGTNLVGAKVELARSLRSLDREKVIGAARRRDVEWIFNPPLASHHGGVWERQIRTIRKVLMAVLTNCGRLTDDILHTVFCDVESIINSRPLTKCSDDVTDDVPLTPNHLLLMRGNFSHRWGKFFDGETYRRQWKQAQSIVTVFWRRWLREYLPELNRRQKWLHVKDNLRVGDLVLLMDENVPRGSWPLGLVQEVNVGRDGLVRSARVKTKTTILTRPITKIVTLECDDRQ